MSESTELDQAAIRARLEAATPGPWEAVVLGSEGYDVRACRPRTPGRLSRVRVARCGYEEWEVDKANAEFIAHARTDIELLLEENARLRRWKAEALPVIAGLQELGRALDLRPGERITGPAAAEAAERLRAALEEAKAEAARFQGANREHIDRIDELETAVVQAQQRASLAAGNESDLMVAVNNAELRAEAAEAALERYRTAIVGEIRQMSLNHRDITGLLRAAKLLEIPDATPADGRQQ